MGFTTGMIAGAEMGTPHYYIDSGGNQWDANTYATIIFDGSGSMNSVITALEEAMGGDYFSSGSASGGDGIKNVDSIRSTVQDYYATGEIEGSPHYNTDDTTNGSDEFEKHVQMITQSESTMYYLNRAYSHNSSAVWPASPIAHSGWHSSDFITPSNFIQIVVCNESHSSYHDGYSGSTWANTEITTSWKLHQSATKTLLGDAGVHYNLASGYTTQAGGRADGYKPSFTLVVLDPGINGAGGHDGPDLGFGFGSTASQRLWVQGAMNGEGSYALDAITVGHNFSFTDFQEVTEWNLRDNMFLVDCLYNESSNSSASFWKARLLSALQQNISI